MIIDTEIENETSSKLSAIINKYLPVDSKTSAIGMRRMRGIYFGDIFDNNFGDFWNNSLCVPIMTRSSPNGEIT